MMMANRSQDTHEAPPSSDGGESAPLIPRVSVARGSKNPSLLRAILKTFGGQLLLSHVIKFVCDLLIMVGPLLQRSVEEG